MLLQLGRFSKQLVTTLSVPYARIDHVWQTFIQQNKRSSNRQGQPDRSFFDAQNVILALRSVYVLQMFRAVTSNTLTS